jgi:imidazolonepropionase-like amidohydrolase
MQETRPDPKDGHWADIIAVADNPLADIATLTDVRFVMVDGKVFKAP